MEPLFNFLVNFFWQLWPFSRVQPWQHGLLIVAGRWTKSLGPGIYPRIPLLMEIETLDTVEQIIDLPNQALQTTDGRTMVVSGALRYHIDDIKAYYLNVQDPDDSLRALVQLEIADFILHANADELTNETIEEDVRDIVRDKAVEWGVAVTRVGVTHLAEAVCQYVTGDNTVGAVVVAATS